MNRHTHLDTNVLRKSFVLTVYELLLKSYYRNTTRQKQNKTKPTVSQTRITNLYGMKGRSPRDRDGMRTAKTRTFKNHKKKQIKTNFTLTYSLASWPKFVNCFNLFNELNVCARGRLVCAQQQQKTRYHETKLMRIENHVYTLSKEKKSYQNHTNNIDDHSNNNNNNKIEKNLGNIVTAHCQVHKFALHVMIGSYESIYCFRFFFGFSKGGR